MTEDKFETPLTDMFVTAVCNENKRLREALAVIYRAHEKVRDEGDAWFITDDTTVGGYICSVLGAPPEEKK